MTETPVLIPWAPGAQYTKVICRLGEPRPDGSDADEYPDLMTQGGTVTITCAAKKIRYSEPDGKARMLTTRPWTFKIRPSDGELYNPESGAVGVYILSGNSAGLDPAGFTWSATVAPDNGESWPVTIPADAGATVDLVSVADIVVPSPGESTLSARVAALEASSGGGGGGIDTEAVQDIVGAMVVAAGGSYNDAAGTITLPSGGSGYPVQHVTLTGDVTQQTTGWPTDQIVTVVYTQDGTGGHTVTYGGSPVTVNTHAGASTLVEFFHDGAGWEARPTAHAASHAAGQPDAITPASIGAQPAGAYATAAQGLRADAITRTNRAIVATSRNGEAARPIISVIDDDGHYDVVTRLAPLMVARGIPLGVAVIGSLSTVVTNPTQRAQLKALQDDHGFEIMSHTFAHYGVHAMTEAEYIADSETMAELMAGYGFKVQNIVYPGGSEGTNKHITARYHLAGFGTAADLNNANTIDNYQIKRVGVGSMMAAPYQTLAEFQALIDTTKAQKRWLVLMTHINATDAAGLQLIADVLDYAIAQGVAIVAPRDGVAEFGNIIQSGRMDSAGQFYIRPEGRIYSSRYQLVDWLPTARLETDAPGLMSRKWVQFEVPPASPWSVGYGIVTERQHLSGWQVQRLETLTGEMFQRRYNGSTWSAWSRTLQGRMQANFTISARTIPAHGQNEYTFNNAVAQAGFGYVATPTGALEAGIVWSVWSHGNGAGRIRLANITGADVALAERVWTVRSIGA